MLQRCCLGFHRLAIMDSQYGMQPLKIHAMPHVWLIYNGEIYNYRQVTTPLVYMIFITFDNSLWSP